jgi:hypothetical protein
MKQTVKIDTRSEGKVDAQAWCSDGATAITKERYYKSGYNITHILTGLTMSPVFKKLRNAKLALPELRALYDWTKDPREDETINKIKMMNDVEEIWKKYNRA